MNQTKKLLEDLLSQFQNLAKESKDILGNVPKGDSLDRASNESLLASSAETTQSLVNTIRLLKKALLRVKEGSYGICEQCQEIISPKRLSAIPWADLCVECQGDFEALPKGRKPSAQWESMS